MLSTIIGVHYGHVLVHMKVILSLIFSSVMVSCQKAEVATRLMTCVVVSEIPESYRQAEAVGYHGHSSSCPRNRSTLLTWYR